MSTITGPDFIALQVHDLETARAFYRDTLGLTEAPGSPPGAVVFQTQPIPLAVRAPLPHDGPLIEQTQRLGLGMALWLHCEDPDVIYQHLHAAGVVLLQPPQDGPFGRFFTLIDPDGYRVTIHGNGPSSR